MQQQIIENISNNPSFSASISSHQYSQKSATINRLISDSSSLPCQQITSLSGQPITLLPFSFHADTSNEPAMDASSIITLVPVSMALNGLHHQHHQHHQHQQHQQPYQYQQQASELVHEGAFIQQETVVSTTALTSSECVGGEVVLVKNEPMVVETEVRTSRPPVQVEAAIDG